MKVTFFTLITLLMCLTSSVCVYCETLILHQGTKRKKNDYVKSYYFHLLGEHFMDTLSYITVKASVKYLAGRYCIEVKGNSMSSCAIWHC